MADDCAHDQPKTPEEDAKIAAQALESGDLDHALFHISWALHAQPTNPGFLELFHLILDSSDDPLVLTSLEGQEVSIAHAAGDLGGAAIASRAVGLDLEAIRQRRPDLWRRMLRPDEYAVLEALGGPTDETQTLLWSLKEAVLKGRRTGLRAGMHSVRLHQLASGVGEGRDAEGGAWRLGYERRGDLWVTWALAE